RTWVALQARPALARACLVPESPLALAWDSPGSRQSGQATTLVRGEGEGSYERCQRRAWLATEPADLHLPLLPRVRGDAASTLRPASLLRTMCLSWDEFPCLRLPAGHRD